MDSKKKKKALLGDIAGIGCGVLVLVMAIFPPYQTCVFLLLSDYTK